MGFAVGTRFMEFNWLVGLAVGTFVGGTLVWLWLRSRPVRDPEVLAKLARYDEAVREWAATTEHARLLKLQLEDAARRETEIQKRADERDKQIANLRIEQAQRQQENLALQEKLATQKTELLDLQKQFKESFENLSNQILHKQTQQFRQTSEENLGQLLNPLKTNLQQFEKTIRETREIDIKDRASVKTQVEQLMGLNQQMAVEAKNLTQALKGDSKIQGDWGETVLERLFEAAGFVEGKHYLKQKNFKNDQGNDLRTDFIVLLPGDKHIIVDSKVSLTAYERYARETDDVAKEQALTDHLGSVRKHIATLDTKRYQDQLKTSADYVVLFMGIEPAWLLALQKDDRLYESAAKSKVILASGTNLFAVLTIVKMLWRQHNANENAANIAKEAGAMYDKLVGFVQNMERIAKYLKDAQNTYEDAMGQLSSGRGNLISKAEKLRKMGASVGENKRFSPSLLTGAEMDAEEVDVKIETPLE